MAKSQAQQKPYRTFHVRLEMEGVLSLFERFCLENGIQQSEAFSRLVRERLVDLYSDSDQVMKAELRRQAYRDTHLYIRGRVSDFFDDLKSHLTEMAQQDSLESAQRWGNE